MLSGTDSAQLALAASEHRAIVTFNVNDFTQLHLEYLANGEEHWGIIFSTEERISVLQYRLLQLLNSTSAEELKNQILWLNEFK